MGNKKDYERVPLPPVQSVGDPAYIRQQQVVLKLKQSFGVSGADYEICLDGEPVLRSKGKALKLYDEKVVSSPSGELFRIKTTSIVPKAFSCYDSGGERFTVKSKLMSFRTQFAIHVAPFGSPEGREGGGEPAELKLQGNAVSSSATITRPSASPTTETETLAEIKRDILSATDMILNGHDYTVTVAPGADWALMAALTLCFNDCLNEPRPTGGGRWRRKSSSADWEQEDGPTSGQHESSPGVPGDQAASR